MSGEPTVRLTRRQVREIDRVSIEEYHVPGIVLMENAARAVTAAAIDILQWQDAPMALIVCGGGNNGGDGFAIARHLHNVSGVEVTLALAAPPEKLSGDALTNWRIASAMRIRAITATPDVIRGTHRGLTIDALFGTGLTDAPRGVFAEIIIAMAEDPAPVLAVDVPSGLDCDTGEPLGACVRAFRTVTFVAEKSGFANPASRAYTGLVIVGDIGCPRELVARVAAGPTS